MKRAPMTEAEIRRAERILALGTWAIVSIAMLFSVLTVTPLVERVTPDRWDWTAPILPLGVDAAVVIVVKLDSVVARLDGDAGRWPVLLRWMTGLATLALNVGDSWLKSDPVGVAVHCIAPLMLIVSAEAGLAYRRSITASLARIHRERQAETDRERQNREAREHRAREEREREQARREHQERERREHAERVERERREQQAADAREQRDHEARLVREQREHEAQLAREEAAREERKEQVEREETARREREREERRERERADERRREQQAMNTTAGLHEQSRSGVHEHPRKAAAAPREHQRKRPVNTSVNAAVNTRPAAVNAAVNGSVNTPKTAAVNTTKLPEDEAVNVIREGMNTRSRRQLADATGWSVGWVVKRIQEMGGPAEEGPAAEPTATHLEPVAS